MRFQGGTAIVSGAASGIGKATAQMLASEGASVVGLDINGAGNEETAKLIKDAGGDAYAVTGDVMVFADWTRTMDEAIGRFGKVDYLCNIAGVVNTAGPDTVVDIEEEHWHLVVDTDLTGTFLGMKAVLPHMIERGSGAIVNISSMAAVRGLLNLAAYSAAKGGVAALTRQAAMEYGEAGVRINAIAPGTINTPILGDVEPDILEDFKAAHIIRRLGEPEEVAAMAAYLLSADASFLTGLLLPMDGGWSVKT